MVDLVLCVLGPEEYRPRVPLVRWQLVQVSHEGILAQPFVLGEESRYSAFCPDGKLALQRTRPLQRGNLKGSFCPLGVKGDGGENVLQEVEEEGDGTSEAMASSGGSGQVVEVAGA